MNGRKITSILLGISLLSTVGGSLFISSFQNNVTITPNILYGDPSTVENLNLNLTSYFEDDFYTWSGDFSMLSLDMMDFLDIDTFEHSWEIQIPLSAPENSRSNYQFQQKRSDFYRRNIFSFFPYIDLNFYSHWMMTAEEHLDILTENYYADTFVKGLSELAERVQKENLSYLREVVSVIDYIEEYKIGTSVFVNHEGKISIDLTEESKKWMRETFQIPVKPDHLMEVFVSVDSNLEVEWYVDYYKTDYPSIESHSVGSGLSGYFSHQLVKSSFDEENNKRPYTSDDIAKLYQVSLIPVDESELPLLEIETLVEIGSLPENQRIASMCLTEDGNIALLVEDLETCLLTLEFYDLSSFTLLDSFPLISSENCSYFYVEQLSEGTCVTMYVDGVTTIWVFTERQGKYDMFLKGIPVTLDHILNDGDYIRSYATITDFVDGKLMLVHLTQHTDYINPYPLVAVFDEKGLVFLSEYHTSQNLMVEQYIHNMNTIKLYQNPSFTSKN